jgi:transcriptional regulator with XRE-family HTH domain
MDSIQDDHVDEKPGSNFDIGERLQIIRGINGLSQRELAKRAKVTNSTISLIEQGRVSPSVGSLEKVLSGIPMSLGEFFEPNLLEALKVFYEVGDMPDVGVHGFRSLLLGCMKTKRDFSMTIDHYRPGSDSGEVDEKHSGEFGGIVIEGELEVSVGKQVKVVKEGEGFYFVRSRVYRFRNISNRECVVVATRSGDLNPHGN